MSQFLTGSMCLDDLLTALKAGHSAFSKSAKNGKTYISIKEWVNDEEDQFGNHASLLLNSDKSAPAAEREKKFYLGNLKFQKTGGEAVTAEQGTNMAAQFEQAAANVAPAATGNGSAPPVISGPVNQGQVAKPVDGLPF